MTVARLARRVLLPAFRRVNVGDVNIKHHWTGDSFRVHSFRHKGYWWHGRKREAESMQMFARLVRPAATVFDIGSHIGYIATYFSSLVGPTGHVFCFEPSPLNLPYLEENVRRASLKNLTIIRAAAGEHPGKVPFFVETLTGQNSTTIRDFPLLKANSTFNGLPADYAECEVEMVTADSIGRPEFVKIDVEGASLAALRGMPSILENTRPRMMVETEPDSASVALLRAAGYRIYTRQDANIFAVHQSDQDGTAICNDSPFRLAAG